MLGISDTKNNSPALRLYWVEPDPDRERAADPLGLGAQSDRIATKILPGLSVNTRRARYLSFFCWAIRNSRDHQNPLNFIHRLEAELACEESLKHWNNRDECSDIVGSSRARKHLDEHEKQFPSRPERLYKNMAFAAYRPLMRQLGLITANRRPGVTEEGELIAKMYQRARGPKPRCLSDISGHEQARLRLLLGLDARTKEPKSARARTIRATYNELYKLLDAGVATSDILERYADVPKKPGTIASALHQAFVWEALSLGLVLAFAMVLRENSITIVAKKLREAQSAPTRWPGLHRFDPGDEAAARWVRGLLRRACDLEAGAPGLDPAPFRLARQFVHNRDVDSFLSGILERHRHAKLGEAWVIENRGKLRIIATKKNLDIVPRPRAYRIDAFAQLLRDLEMIR